MTFLSRLGRWARSRTRPRDASRPAAPRTTVRVEQLEGRDLPAPVLYANDTVGRLYTVDAATGDTNLIGATGVPLTDLAFDGAGHLYGATGDGRIYAVDPDTAAVQQVGSVGAQINALAFGKNGMLFAATPNGSAGSTLYRINLAAGRVLKMGTTTGAWSAGDLASGPDGTMYMSTKAGTLVAVNKATAAVTKVGNLPTKDVNGLAFDADGHLFGMATASRAVYLIDPTTGAGTKVSTVAAGVGAPLGAAFQPEQRQTFAFFFPGEVNATGTTGMDKLQKLAASAFGTDIIPVVLPWPTTLPPSTTLQQWARQLISSVLAQQGAGPDDRVILVGHGFGANLARLIAPDVRNDLIGSQPAYGLITVDPIDWAKAAATPDQSKLSYALPAGLAGNRVLNIVQRNASEKYRGYVITGAVNNDTLGRGADGVWTTSAKRSGDDTTHSLIDDSVGQDGTMLGVYTAILQQMDTWMRSA